MINQISIFLENKYGTLKEIFTLLSEENIQIIAAMVADTSEFGILRLIVNDTQLAYRLLKKNNINVNLTEVLAIATQPSADDYADVLSKFTNAGLCIEYMYCFSVRNKSFLILKINDIEKALVVIKQNNLDYITESDNNSI